LGVGTVTSPSTTLEVKATTGTVAVGSTTGTNESWYRATNTGGNFWHGRDNSAGTYFGTPYAAALYSDGAYPMNFYTNGVERMRIPAAGGLQVVNSISVGNATPTTSGAGITFPATQSASSDANTLDDYEEGTWTPTLTTDGGTPPTVSSYTTRTGTYTKIGNLVIATCSIRATVSNVGVGSAVATGLPFTSAGFLDGVALGIRDILTSTQPVYSFVSGSSVLFSVGYNTNSNVYLTFTISYRV
jgi:hypothetical protein